MAKWNKCAHVEYNLERYIFSEVFYKNEIIPMKPKPALKRRGFFLSYSVRVNSCTRFHPEDSLVK